jgi:hypothetical protein
MGKERRQFSRAPEPFFVQYRRLDWTGEPWKAVQAVNISASGIRATSPDLLEAGTALELQLRLPLESGEELFRLKGTVAWSQSVAAGVAEIGIQFQDITVDQQMRIDDFVQFLLQHPRPNPPPSRG